MGFFSDQAGALLSKMTGSQDQHNLLGGVLGMLNGPEVGGVQGLVDKFKSAGLGHLVDGWVAQGPNPPVSPGELQKVFSPDQLNAFAQKLGINPEEATKHLATLLPGVVNHLTPNGTVPQGGIDATAVLGALKAKLFGGSESPAPAETA